MALEAAASSGTSQRLFAKQHGIPRSTLQHWLANKDAIDASPALVAFFESSEGLAFLHRLVLAIEFVVSFVCGGGVRAVATALELAGLDKFVANSVGSRHKVAKAIESELCAFAQQERERLAKSMKPKTISMAQDETFHPAPCLVAMEPVSNFILVEQYAKSRNAASWSAAVSEAVQGLDVKIIQSTSDEAKGLLRHVRDDLKAQHSPDLFHIQRELSMATSLSLRSQTRRAEEALKDARANCDAVLQQMGQQDPTPGCGAKAASTEARLAKAQAEHTLAGQALEGARSRQQRARRAVRGIGRDYHPIDLKSGALRPAEKVEELLIGHFAEIEQVATEATLPDRACKGIAKARRLLAAMVCTLTFFRRQVDALIEHNHLTADEVRIVETYTLPVAYLERAGRKASSSDERADLDDVAQRLGHEMAPELDRLSPDRRDTVVRVGGQAAEVFQRSSSCVEGRNGQLALHHHHLHRLSPKRLEALTAVHNYFIRRRDGTTAADRFFGSKTRCLFEWLVDHVDLPARPARRRSRPAPALLH